MSRKHSYEYVQQFFSDRGCQLIETEYINNSTSMQYICNCGEKSKISFHHFKEGKRCKGCAGNKTYTIEYMSQFFEDQNCQLLETKYVNNAAPMRYVCSCGKESIIAFSDFKTGHRCRQCGIEKERGSNHYKWNPDRAEACRIRVWRTRNNSIVNNCHNAFRLHKSKHSFDLLGYTPLELGTHLENHSNYKYTMNVISNTNDKFSIDHIFPVRAFVDYSLDHEEYIYIANCFENLQPMPLKENSSKGDNYIPKEFELWLATKGVYVTPQCSSPPTDE